MGAIALSTALLQGVPDDQRRSVFVASLVMVPTLTVVYAVTDVLVHQRPNGQIGARSRPRIPNWRVTRGSESARVVWGRRLRSDGAARRREEPSGEATVAREDRKTLVGFVPRFLRIGVVAGLVLALGFAAYRGFGSADQHQFAVAMALTGMFVAWSLALAVLLSSREQLDVPHLGGAARRSTLSSQEGRDPDFKAVIQELDTSIERLRMLARLIFAMAGAILLLAVIATSALSWHAADLIMKYPDEWTLFAFELVRTTAVATVLATAVWGTLNLGRAALDQAARHEKRLIAAHFLHFTLHKYEPEIKKKIITLDQVMLFLRSWSDNVESAFTSVKYGKTKNDAMSMSVNRDGAAYAEGQNSAASASK